MRGVVAFLLLLAVSAGAPVAALGQGNVAALVIGNGDYASSPLRTAVNDARLLAQALQGIGIDVTVRENLHREAMRAVIADFARDEPPGGVALFFFAGHGVQIQGRNFLVPIGARLAGPPGALAGEVVALDDVLASLERGRARTVVVILDAAHDPMPGPGPAQRGSGLAALHAPARTVIALAASPGHVAVDTGRANSPYVEELVGALGEPGLGLDEILLRVRRGVHRRTGGRQVPWETSALAASIVLSPMVSRYGPPAGSSAPRSVAIPRSDPGGTGGSPGIGSLRITSATPGLEVWVDDRSVGALDPGSSAVEVKLPAGTHTVRARTPGVMGWERQVEVTEGRQTALVIDLLTAYSVPARSDSEPQTGREPLRPTPTAPRPAGTLALERYPTVESPDEVAPGQEFAVQVSLTVERTTPEVSVLSGRATPTGQLSLTLPAESGQDSWPIDVVVSAPGFAFRGGRNSASIAVPRQGDSTPALFHLRSVGGPASPVGTQKIYATFWFQGTYLAKVVRAISVAPAPIAAPAPTVGGGLVERRSTSSQRGQGTTIDGALRIPDLTIWVLERAGGHSEMIISAKGAQPSSHTFVTPADLGAWLDGHYGRFVAEMSGGVEAREGAPPLRDRTIPLLQGFGRELYRRFAPPPFKEAFWRLHDRLGREFRSIQIYSNNPVLPWELMRPSRADGSDERDFLSLDYRVARWHVSEEGPQLDRAPQALTMNELVVIAPRYRGALALSSQSAEVGTLQTFTGFRQVPGRFGDLRTLFGNLPEGIIHFAGHGVIQSRPGLREYFIRLEDHDLDVATFRGMTAGLTRRHPLIFFNACEIGRTQRVVNFVDGWAPAALESGASGYVGGLWTLGDAGAAEFASVFYRELRSGLTQGEATVADALSRARRGFYTSGDPTFLGYVYYGDPNFRLVPTRTE